jgi:hypothetical protein
MEGSHGVGILIAVMAHSVLTCIDRFVQGASPEQMTDVWQQSEIIIIIIIIIIIVIIITRK